MSWQGLLARILVVLWYFYAASFHSINSFIDPLFLVRIDPMPDMQGRNLASNLRGIGVEQNNVPEWKAHITGGAKGKLSTSIEALTL